jgi:hypothetical protein
MPEDQSLTLAVGRMEGQMREVVHTMNNLAQKFEDLARAFDRSAHLPAAVEENKADIAALALRVTALEAIEHQRRGAVTLGAALLKALPWVIVGKALGI